MIPTRDSAGGTVLAGVGLGIAGYGLFSLQDAAVKWLVDDFAVWQVLFVRSVTLTALLALIARRAGLAAALRSRNKASLTLRAAIILAAWLCYYNAARQLQLAELTTLYYAAPIMVVIMSIVMLKERVHAARWIAIGLGFAGVLVAANPTGRPDLVPAGLVLIAAALWAWSNILVRQIMAYETTLNQMLFSNGAFVVMAGIAMPWLWQMPDPASWALMIGLGILSGAGQYLLFEGFRLAPASAIAPCEYTSLVWAFLLGLAIWGDVPASTIFAGAGLIALGSLVLVISEHHRGRVQAAAGAPASPIESPVRPSIKPVGIKPADIVVEPSVDTAAEPVPPPPPKERTMEG